MDDPDFIMISEKLRLYQGYSQRFFIMVIVNNPDFIKVVGTQTLSRLVDDPDFIKISEKLWLYQGLSAILYHGYSG